MRRFVTYSRVARPVVERFVAGESLDQAMAAARRLEESGIRVVLDHLGEHATQELQADVAAGAYLDLLDRIAAEHLDAHISVKLTQLGLDLSFEGCLARLERICRSAGKVGTPVAIDMESHAYTDRTIEIYGRMRPRHDRLVLCLQAYLKRTGADLEALLPSRPSLRLCKGAYNEPKEIRLTRFQTRDAFRRLLGASLRACPYTAVATHDELLIKEALRLARRYRIASERFEVQMLYGVRRELQARLAAEGLTVRVYVPFGTRWFGYLMRRLAERPANLRLLVEALIRG